MSKVDTTHLFIMYNNHNYLKIDSYVHILIKNIYFQHLSRRSDIEHRDVKEVTEAFTVSNTVDVVLFRWAGDDNRSGGDN